MKRLMDVILALAFLPVAVVICTLCGTVFFALYGEPPMFTQTRLGKEKKPFKVVKLRTMRSGTEELPTHKVRSQSIPKFGRVMRKLKVDELPQLINVLAGEMSFVGPRPCLPSQIDVIEMREVNGVFALKPGITGTAQIQGIDMSNPVILALADRDYLENNSVLGDFFLICRTVLGSGAGDKTSA